MQAEAPATDSSFLTRSFKGTGFLLCAQGGRLVFQAAALFLTARYLGAGPLGAVTVLLALGTMVRPFSGFGYHIFVVQEVARDRSQLPSLLREAFSVHAVGGLGLGLLLAGLVVPLLGLEMGWPAVLILLLSELFLGGLFHFLCNSWQAEENFAAQSRWYLTHPAIRFALILSLVLAGKLSILTFAIAHGLALLITVIAGYRVRLRSLESAGPAKPAAMLRNARSALPFAFGMLGLVMLPEIDKLLMPRLAGLEISGQYAMGIKVVSFAALPLGALLFTFMPRFFRDGQAGSVPALMLTRQAWKLTIPYAVVIGGLLAIFARLPLMLLGDEYLLFPDVVRMGVGILLLQALHLPAGDALNGTGFARYRAGSQICASILAGILAWLCIPVYGWRGALLAAYAGHGTLVILLLMRLLREVRNERR
jgi:O-antigen/teichoic acid export membrane protein